jgi:hypothetical protein
MSAPFADWKIPHGYRGTYFAREIKNPGNCQIQISNWIG